MTFQRWLDMMVGLGFASNYQTCEELIKVYSHQKRHFHNHKHISACLNHLHVVRDQVGDRNSMALAFWFHDAIHHSFKSDNKRKSADWAKRFMQANGANDTRLRQVEQLIMATCPNAQTVTADSQIFSDINMAILGAKAQLYDIYEIYVRKEYGLIPECIYRQKRKTVLQRFLKRARIYNSDYFHEKLERQAQENLRRTLLKLNSDLF